jgi:hypothetical protein
MNTRAPAKAAAQGSGSEERCQPPEQRSQDELIMDLERDQFVAATSRPLPPARLSPHATIGLWTLRAVAVLLGLMVIYTFVAELHL